MQSVRAVETATAGVNVFFGVKRYRPNYQFWLGFTLPVLVSMIRKGIFGISPCLPFSWPPKRWRFSQFNQSPVRSSITSYDWQVSSYNSFVKNNCLWLSCFCITERASLQCNHLLNPRIGSLPIQQQNVLVISGLCRKLCKRWVDSCLLNKVLNRLSFIRFLLWQKQKNTTVSKHQTRTFNALMYL